MRRMADSTDVASLPDGFDLYGVYDDGSYNNINAAILRFGPSRIVAITVFAIDHFGTVLDVENGDATPAQAPGWVQARRLAGVIPTVYCSLGVWQEVRDAFRAAGIAEPFYWIAAYPGNGAVLYSGSVAHQWIDHGGYDESVVADYWPGVDHPQSGEDVPAPTDVVDSWSVPGTDGAVYVNLHADGGLFAYGGLDPTQLEYVAVANDGARYHFGPSQTPNVISYPGLPPAEKAGTRYFVSMTALSYQGKPVGAGPEGPAGPPGHDGAPGTPGSPGNAEAAVKAALTTAANALP